jgi:hypothetical protein
MVHQGRQILLDSLEIELSASPEGETGVFAVASTKAKIPGLSPNEKGLQVTLELGGEVYEIEEATVFDVDFDLSGTTTVQITGTLRHIPAQTLDDV